MTTRVQIAYHDLSANPQRGNASTSAGTSIVMRTCSGGLEKFNCKWHAFIAGRRGRLVSL
jgi:hypothetical protein